MERFLRTAEMFGENSHYLGTHNISFIPKYLLKRLPELGSYHIVDIPINEFFDMDINFLQKAISSSYWSKITSTLHPSFHNFYVEMTDYVQEVSIILTREVYDKMKNDYCDELKELLDLDLVSLYVYTGKFEFS